MFDVPDEILKQFRETDVMMPSFPRSGSTWMRLLISDIVMQLHGIETDASTVHGAKADSKRFEKEAPLEVQVYRWIALNAYETDLLGTKPPIDLPFRLIMSHHLYSSELNFKTLYLFRNPYDVLCSYYHLCLSYQYFGDRIPSIDEFCQGKKGWNGRNAFEDYCNHLRGYISFKRENPEKSYFISYESLYEKTIPTLMGVFQFCGLNPNPVMCQRAAENLEFKKLKSSHAKVIEKVQEQGGIEGEFFRKGRPGTGREELNEESIRVIQERAIPIYNQALELEAHESHYNPQFLSRVGKELQHLSEFDSEYGLTCQVPPRLIFLKLEVQQKAAKVIQLEQRVIQLEQRNEELEQRNAELADEVSHTKLELQHLRNELNQVESRLIETENQLRATQGKLVSLEKERCEDQLKLSQKQDKIQQLRKSLQAKREELQETNRRLANARETISAMKRSKFWKLQKMWSRFRSSF